MSSKSSASRAAVRNNVHVTGSMCFACGLTPGGEVAGNFDLVDKMFAMKGKKPIYGNTVSHANNRKRRRFLPNLHTHRFWLEGEKRFVTLRVSTHGLRTIDKLGLEKVLENLRASGDAV